MSADNYMLVRKDGKRFAVSMGFASDDGLPGLRPHDPRFDRLEDALSYADGEYTEYGVRFDKGVLPAKPKQRVSR